VSRIAVAVGLLCLCTLCAGCLTSTGGDAPPSTTESIATPPTETPTATEQRATSTAAVTATPTTEGGTACGGWVDVWIDDDWDGNASDDGVYRYEDLPADRRATFDDARENGLVEPSGAEPYQFWIHEVDVVLYEGSAYRTGIVEC